MECPIHKKEDIYKNKQGYIFCWDCITEVLAWVGLLVEAIGREEALAIQRELLRKIRPPEQVWF